MKKILPYLVLVLVFSGFLAGQIVFEMMSSSANLKTKEKEKATHYESGLRDLHLKTTKGTTFTFKEKVPSVLILNFWASWCKPCLAEFPSLVSFNEKFKGKDVVVIGINTDENNPEKAIKKMESKFDLNFESVVDKNGELANKFLVTSIPMSIIFFNGKVFDIRLGQNEFTDSDFISSVEAAIEKSKNKKS